ncbi:MAG: RluA family pseudouridine synthase [Spirochaetales bacterium]|nr:RluA family pseudouridine synthase [Spirochaetales bacterium]
MEKSDPIILVAGPDDGGKRLDRVARGLLGSVPLSAVFRGIRTGDIRLNGRRSANDARLVPGDEIRISGRYAESLRAAPSGRPEASTVPRVLPDVLGRTRDLVFVSKPRGMLSHGAGGLDELAADILGPLPEISLAFRPAPLHRLDRNTSGVVAISASIRGARAFSAALRDGRVSKRYLALVEGRLDGPEDWSAPLERDGTRKITMAARDAGKAASTFAEPVACDGRLTLALVSIGTGVTHQIRAHAALAGHPLAGDLKYGGKPFPGGYVLHAWALDLPADLGCETPAAVRAPLPPAALEALAARFGSQALAPFAR